MKDGFVYILTNKIRGTLYIGVTNDLLTRVGQHKEKLIEGFTKTHNLTHLVYYEKHRDIQDAITREKQMKKWNRIWKIELIENTNPKWKDLFEDLL